MPRVIDFPEVTSLTPGYKFPMLNASGNESKIDYQNLVPYGSIFRVTFGSNWVVPPGGFAGAIPWDLLVYETQATSGWDGANYRYTVPITGFWMVKVHLYFQLVDPQNNLMGVALQKAPGGTALAGNGSANLQNAEHLNLVGFAPISAGTAVETYLGGFLDSWTVPAGELTAEWTMVLLSPQWYGVA